MEKIRVMIVDDHTLVRDGICALLELAGDLELVGEASNGREALEAVEKLRPDVVLMDISMPIMDGLEAMRRIYKEFPDSKIIALTQYDDKDYIFPAVEAGACGFISKTAASAELVSGIRAVFSGDSFLSPSVAKVFIDDYQHLALMKEKDDPYKQLTNREREVLKLIADGFTVQQIADMLTIAPKTVEGHKTGLMSKLGIHNRIDLVKYALRRGITSV